MKSFCQMIAIGVGLACFTAPASAAYILPQMGGGSVGQASAPMKHADIYYLNSTLVVPVDDSVATSELRELTAPDEFDPSKPWAALTGRAYNYQYGWNAGGFTNLPTGASVWIEQLEATPGLEVYDRSPNSLNYAPIFGTDGSSTRWRWTGSMTHNAYAVENPTEANYFARYEVYLGSTTTGEPLAGYASTEVTFEFLFDLPLAGDYDLDGTVNAADYTEWVTQYGSTGPDLSADGNQDGTVDAADYTIWRDALEQVSLAMPTAVPEPSAALLLLIALITRTAYKRSA